MSRILIAPDSFKGSATSIEVAEAIAKGWRSVRPDDDLILFPFADGGEGTLLAIEYAPPLSQRIYCPEVSPNAYWLLLDGSTAVVELAQISGLTILPALDPMGAHTFAFGQLLLMAAQDSRVERIYCALGGSASTDAGVGALMALGCEFLDSSGVSIGLGGEQLAKIASISTSHLIAPPIGGVFLLVDVQSPLIGQNGAASIFSPQKGATKEQVILLENALVHFSSFTGFIDSPGSGAAGGTAFGLRALWGAKIENGAKRIAELCALKDAIFGADLVITGEGRLDSQSYKGKVVSYIIELAQAAGVPFALCTGSIEGEFPSTSLGGVSLIQLAGSMEMAIKECDKYLVEAGVQLAHLV
ncbi:MAG: glycerate kinase [Actinomycetota bacterium]|nr:glycerate kinase [Actinomycetota bacterium]